MLPQRSSTASAFVVNTDKRHILTNAHAVSFVSLFGSASGGTLYCGLHLYSKLFCVFIKCVCKVHAEELHLVCKAARSSCCITSNNLEFYLVCHASMYIITMIMYPNVSCPFVYFSCFSPRDFTADSLSLAPPTCRCQMRPQCMCDVQEWQGNSGLMSSVRARCVLQVQFAC